MIPGVDYTEILSPVATDASLHIQLRITLYWYEKGWQTKSCDIEAPFLESLMEKLMYIEPHSAMVACGFTTEEQIKRTANKLEKYMYGNVDAAIKLFKLLASHVTNNKGINMF